MVEWYHSVYDKARKIEGASQRVQEDTVKFSRIMESLGTSFISSVLIIIEFTPILFGLDLDLFNFDCNIAWSAAMIEKAVKRSNLFKSFFEKKVFKSILTSPAILTLYSEVSKEDISLIPFFPFFKDSKKEL